MFSKQLFNKMSLAKNYQMPSNYQSVNARLKDKNPFLITIFIEGLDEERWEDRRYVADEKLFFNPKHDASLDIDAPAVLRYRQRYYNLPDPFCYFDWCNPIDNIFVWEESEQQQLAVRSSLASTWQRQRNAEYALGFAQINQTNPVPTLLFIYTRDNKLKFLHRFSSLHLPGYGLNTSLQIDVEETEKIFAGVKFLSWGDSTDTAKVRITQSLN